MELEVLDYYKIKYQIIRKDVKRLSISYNRENVLEIKMPLHLSFDVVNKFVNDHIDWILKNEPTKPLPHESYNEGDPYLFLGKVYHLHIIYQWHEEVIKGDNVITIYAKDNSRVEALLEKYRRDAAEMVFNEVLYKSFEVIKNDLKAYPTLVIKPSKSKWGCCYFTENKIMLNLSLIHVPLYLIEYVVFHELTHFIYHDHQAGFHAYLRKYIPDEVDRRRALKNYNTMYK